MTNRFSLVLFFVVATGSQAFAQRIFTEGAAGGCNPTQGRIIQNVCLPGQPTAATLAWEDTQVRKWLALNGLPASDAEKIYRYGRAELRNEIASFMFNELMVSSGYGGLPTPYETWFRNFVWTREKQYWQYAVDQKNILIGNPCAFRPDPILKSKFNLNYSYERFCGPGGLATLFGKARVPTKEYFQTAALNEVYLKKTGEGPGLGDALLDAVNDQFPVADLIHAAAPVATVTAAGVFNTPRVVYGIFPKAKGREALAAMRENSKVKKVNVLKNVLRSVRFLRAAGPAIVLELAIETGLAAGMEAVSNEENMAEITSLDGDLQNVIGWGSAPPITLVANQDDGFTKLNVLWGEVRGTMKDSTDPIPGLPSEPLMFRIEPQSGPSTLSARITWTDWYDTQWDAYVNDRWLAGKAHHPDHGEDYEGYQPSLKFKNWDDKGYMAVLLDRKFLVVRDEMFEGNACGPDTLLGITPPSAVPTCRSYVANSIQLKDKNGNKVTVTIPEPPRFTAGLDFIGFTTGVASHVDFAASGAPLPEVKIIGSLSPHITFTVPEAGKGRISYDGATDVDMTHVVIMRATTSAEYAERTVKIALREAPQITSPNQLTIHGGVPVQFEVTTTGSLPMTIAADGGLLPPGVTLTDHGNGTATIAGKFDGSTIPGICFNLSGQPCGITATPAFGGLVRQPFKVTLIPPPVPQIVSTTTPELIEGIANEHVISTAGALTNVHFRLCGTVPNWVSLADHGDGTATLNGKPPVKSTGVTDYPLRLEAYAESGFNFGCDPLGAPTITIRAIPVPQFTGDESITVVAGVAFTTSLAINQQFGSGRASAQVLGHFPAGVTQTVNSNGVTLSGTPASGSGGEYPIDINITNPFTSQVLRYTMHVIEPPSFTSESEFQLLANRDNEVLVQATGYPLDTMQLSYTGTLPGTMTFTPSGETNSFATIAGNPGSVGTHTITVRAKNSDRAGFTKQQTITLRVVEYGDANGDGGVSCVDVAFVRAHLKARVGAAGYDVRADIDRNGVIDLKDLAILSRLIAKAGGAPCA